MILRKVNLRFTCPLCHQPVSASLYRKITGIWEERTRVLAKIKATKSKLLDKLRQEKLKFNEKRREFKLQKDKIIQSAVERGTNRLKHKLNALRNRERRIEERANKRIEQAITSAHSKAEKLAEKRTRERMVQLRKELRASVKDQLKKERERATQSVHKRYERLQNTFRTTLQQMKTQNKELRKSKERIDELERQLQRHTTPQVEGLLYEDNLIRELKKRFPEDKFDHTGKGGDIVHHIMSGNEQIGVIVYECKRVKNYSSSHVKQALEAKEKRRADFAILVTNAMKKGTQGFFTERSVLIVHATGVLSLAGILRRQIVQIGEMKLGQLQREKAIRLTLDYLQGPEFSNSIEAIVSETITLYSEMKNEVKEHVRIWRKRYDSYAKIHEEALAVKDTTTTVLRGEEDYKKQIQKGAFPALIELPEVDEHR